MTETDNTLPDWISRQATLGPNVKVDGEQTEGNFFWYLLTVCCPLIFESYAIILHPFWINRKAKDLVSSGLTLTKNQVDKQGFSRVDWADFFKLYEHTFNLDTANQTQEIIRQGLMNGGTKQVDWPVYVWYPAEGNCETEDLKFVLRQAKELFGDDLVNYYYCLLKTENWENEKIYRGNISEFEELKNKPDIRENPTAIFPDNKKWCIVSDYDLPFTYVGGTTELIHKITNNNEYDIFRIEPKFKEQIIDNISH
jgi:hypothetical protein